MKPHVGRTPGNLLRKLYKRQTLALLLLIWAPLLVAQQLVDDATSSSTGTEVQVPAAPAENESAEGDTSSGHGIPSNAELLTSSSKPEIAALIRPVKPMQDPGAPLHPSNRKLVLGTEVFKWAALVADVESTQAGLNSGRCQETNPLYGKNPSRLKMYGLAVPVLGLHTYLAKRHQRRNPRSKLWAISNMFIGGMHSYAAARNLRCF
jgi:hypothetical protein